VIEQSWPNGQTHNEKPSPTAAAAPVLPRRRILFLLYRFPYPLIGGDRVKPYHLLRHFAKIADVDLITLDESSEITPERLAHIQQFAKVEVVPFDKGKATMRVLSGLLGSRPIEHNYYYSADMQQAVNRAVTSKEYDLIVCFFLRTAEYVKGLKGAAKLLIAEDARVIMQERATEKIRLTPQYLVRKIDSKRLKSYEPSMSQHFDHVTFVAEEDRARIFAANPRLSTSVVSNGVDLDKFRFNGGERNRSILFAGHLGIYHNKLMAERLVGQIFPLIQTKLPDVTLKIVGKNPSNKLRTLITSMKGVELFADVPDVAPYLQSEGIFLHPQTVGSGIQNKLLEAMACGIPVITTPVGAGGIGGLENGVHAIVDESDHQLADRAIRLLSDDAQMKSLQHNARQLIEERYTWQAIYHDLDRAIEICVPDFFDRVTAKPLKVASVSSPRVISQSVA
jgi:glycosyltransferase involved in cell wall biosynthesis